MNSTMAFALVTSLLFAQQSTKSQTADDKVFSGPQVTEKFPALEVVKFGDKDGKKIDFIKQAHGKPVVVIFMHQLTRPAAATVRAITNYCAKREKDGLRSCVIFLTDDPTEGEQRMKRAKRAIVPQDKTLFGISHQGIEGPGSYGLNRNVTLTVLVGKGGKVTANFAIKQPSVQVDVLKITKEITKLVGGKEPTLAELQGNRRRKTKTKNTRERDPNIRRLLRPLISKDASPEEVEKAGKAIEDYAAEHPRFKSEIGSIVRRIENAGRLESYGTETARKFLKKWGKEWKSAKRKRKKQIGRKRGSKIDFYLRPVISKDAGPKRVHKTAKELEDYAAEHPRFKVEIGNFARKIQKAGTLKRYGTETARTYLKKWAKEWQAPKQKQQL